MALCTKLMWHPTPHCSRGISSFLKGNLDKYSSRPRFDYSENQKRLVELARKFAREEVAPVAAHHDRTGKLPWELVKKAHSLGLMNGYIPKEIGGPGRGVLDACLISEELSWACSGLSNIAVTTQLSQLSLLIGGNKELHKKYLGRLVKEPLLTACCVSEPGSGSDVNGITTQAVKKGNEYILNGEKKWIGNAGVADWYFVLARTNLDPKAKASQAFTGFIVERETLGVVPGPKANNVGHRAADCRGVRFEDVHIPKVNVVAEEGAGFKIIMATFDKSRLMTASGAVGLAQRALDESLKYLVDIQTNSTVEYQSMLADMAIGIESSRLLWMKAAREIDQGRRNTMYSSMAKVLASEVAMKCANAAIQVFGENGYNTKYPVEKLLRDAKAFQIFEGTSEILKQIITREMLKNLLS